MVNEDDLICEYWSEIEYGDHNETTEYCRKDNRSCTCCGTKEECNNGEFMPRIVEDLIEDR
jgi:hypothetical protein